MTNPKVKSFLSLAIAKSRTSSEISTSSEELDFIHNSRQQQIRLEAVRQGWEEIHGFRGSSNWNAPFQLKRETNLTHGFAAKHSKYNEYEDEPYVFHQKIKLLAQMILAARHCCVCSGKDLATVQSNTRYKKIIKISQSPTITHHALVALYNNGHIQHWLQQYHDGLPQQCGFPQERLNEIHGSDFDPSNPYVEGEGTLRADLFEDLLAWEERTDLALCIGTCGRGGGGGMASDRLFRTVAKKGRQGLCIGEVIVGLQHTPDDHCAALKIYADSDHVMEALLQQLRINLRVPFIDDSAPAPTTAYQWQLPKECLTATKDVFRFPYDFSGKRLPLCPNTTLHCCLHNCPVDNHFDSNYHACSKDKLCQHHITLDLQQGSAIVICGGTHHGRTGVVVGKTPQGHYRLQFKHLYEKRSSGASRCRKNSDSSRERDGCGSPGASADATVARALSPSHHNNSRALAYIQLFFGSSSNSNSNGSDSSIDSNSDSNNSAANESGASQTSGGTEVTLEAETNTEAETNRGAVNEQLTEGEGVGIDTLEVTERVGDRRGEDVVEMVLGLWWLESAARGGVSSLPITNISTNYVKNCNNISNC